MNRGGRIVFGSVAFLFWFAFWMDLVKEWIERLTVDFVLMWCLIVCLWF